MFLVIYVLLVAASLDTDMLLNGCCRWYRKRTNAHLITETIIQDHYLR